MNLFKKALGRLGRSSVKKLAVTAAVFLTLTGASIAGVSAVNNSKAEAGDCSGNSIVVCGEPNRASLIAKIRSTPELQKIYAHFGLNAADYDRFVSSARPGVAYASNNTIVVDGRVVATNVWSIGRYASYQGSGYQTVAIAGAGTYYGNVNSKAFASPSTTIPVDVLFNQTTGAMQFAVMTTSCGNPATGTIVKPTFSCTALNATAQGNNVWKFNTNASAANGATITKLVYNYGDGSAAVTTTNPATVVSHTFTKNSTVTVSVYVSLPGGGQAILTNCKKAITFTPPPAVFACTLLSLTPGKIDATTGNQSYTLTATASATNATIKSYGFTFGDGSAVGTVATAAKTATTTHSYKPGTFTASVSVTVVTNTGVTKTVTAASCAKPVTVKPAECKPGIPVGSPQCKPSTLACVSLTLTPGAPNPTSGATVYTLNAKATADNATISGYTFTFGDGATTPVTTTATTASTTHTYNVGTFTASVVVNGKDAAGKVITSAANPDCAKPVTVKTPECKPGVPVNSPECKPSSLTCVNLTATPGAIDSVGNQTFTFAATSSADNATITDYSFDFGDDKTATVTSSATTASTTHVYAPGTATATVIVNGKDASGNAIQAPTNPKCSAPITVKTPECKPGVPSGSKECFTYTCDEFTITKGDNRTVTIATFKASTTNPNAQLSNVVVDWGDSTTPLSNLNVIGQTHQFTADQSYTITATADFKIAGQTADTTVSGPNCAQTVSFTTAPTPPSVLPNTGAGNVISIFGAAAVIGTLGHRLFLARRLKQQN